ncbi:PEST proteolytic signal-containing nuclear protein isoform X1 [Poecilia reticulata]|uniref:PEST proteolytic signal-containing nuclear protein n=1 Tax=Poecilia reticulata TaxID=8081 RepID=A0A3P9Q6R8_POERE|nr:PREDICTED: PEST proteolytic signal-containing nuclear protein isoform X1 [Poecilia reticulata]
MWCINYQLLPLTVTFMNKTCNLNSKQIRTLNCSFEHSPVPQSSCSPCTGGGDGTAVKRTSQHLNPEDEDESSADQPAPCKTSKIGFSMGSKMAKKSNPISIKLGATKPKEVVPPLPPKKLVSVFDEDDDSEPEEMPPEAKMRMKNIGRETPTSAGPNSFNKGKQGFSDNQKLWERKLKAQSDK